jgi:hypothetical protein
MGRDIASGAGFSCSVMDLLLKIKWRPEIGDPTFMGWFTVAAYLIAALLAWRAWARPGGGSGSRIWLGVAIVMAFLCLNKQFDLQSLFTDLGREIAWHGGWYGQRRKVQKVFVVAVLAGSVLFGGWFAWRFRAFLIGHKLLAFGLLFLLTFIVVRAISFHHVDVFLKDGVGGVRWNWILELTGIFLVAVAALREGKRVRERYGTGIQGVTKLNR